MENNNRRDFLKTGALAGAALLATSAFGVATGCSGKADKENSNTPQKSKRRTLGSGNHSIEVSALGLGCMGMSYHRSFIPDGKAMITLLRRAYDLGMDFVNRQQYFIIETCG